MPREMHAVSRRGTGHRRETELRGRRPTRQFPGPGDIRCNLNYRNDYENCKFYIHQCESHVKSELDTIYLNVNARDAKKLKFLIYTGAEISIIKSSSQDPGANYQLRKSVEIKEILKTEGIVELKLLTDRHERVHTFHVLGEPSALQ